MARSSSRKSKGSRDAAEADVAAAAKEWKDNKRRRAKEVEEERQASEEEEESDEEEEEEQSILKDEAKGEEEEEEEGGGGEEEESDSSSGSGSQDDDDDDESLSEEEGSDDDSSDSDSDGGVKTKKSSDFEADLGHMAGFNTAPLDPRAFGSTALSRNTHLKKLAQDNVQRMFRDLILLPGVDDEVSLKELPEPVFRLPRHKQLPKPRPETRWEKFSREKGILNRKRERMVYDEESQTWAPRWGYGRHSEKAENSWLVELDDKDANDTDKFGEIRKNKKMRVLKNRQKFLRNKAEAEQKQAITQVENLSVPGARAGASKRGKEKVSKALKSAQVSTASMGRFDVEMAGEGKRQLGSSKRKFLANTGSTDIDRDQKILARLLGKHTGGASNRSAYEDGGPAPHKKGRKGTRY